LNLALMPPRSPLSVFHGVSRSVRTCLDSSAKIPFFFQSLCRVTFHPTDAPRESWQAAPPEIRNTSKLKVVYDSVKVFHHVAWPPFSRSSPLLHRTPHREDLVFPPFPPSSLEAILFLSAWQQQFRDPRIFLERSTFSDQFVSRADLPT